MTKIERARIRNWSKARVIGILVGFPSNYAQGVFTEEESKIMEKMSSLKQLLLDNWEKNSKELGMKIKPRKRLEIE